MCISLQQPLVSVVALCYNQERYLIDTLQSIHTQTMQNFELIYVDDASNDNSAKVAVEWLRKNRPAARHLLHTENQGICRTLNEALGHCTGKYIQLVACDDILNPRKLEIQTALLDQAASLAAVVYSDAQLIDHNGQQLPVGSYSAHARLSFPICEPFYEQQLVRNCIPATTTLIRRSVFDTIGTYDEKLRHEDWDMWLRIAREFSFVYSEYVSAQYRIHDGNFHKNLSAWNDDKYWILKKHISHGPTRKRLLNDVFYGCLSHTPPPREIRLDCIQWSDEMLTIPLIRRWIIMYPAVSGVARFIFQARVVQLIFKPILHMKNIIAPQ